MVAEVNIKLPLGEFGFAEIPIVVIGNKGPVQLLAAIDTGAYYNKITQEIIDYLGVLTPVEDVKVNLPATTNLTSLKGFELDMFLKGCDMGFKLNFHVMPIHKYHVLIGNSFLSFCRSFNYQGTQNCFELII